MFWLPYSSHTSHHPSQTPCLPWISYATQKLTLDSCKMVEKQSEVFHTLLEHFFPSFKQNFIAYRSSSRPDCIFRVYSNFYCSCSFEPEIIRIGQSSHKIYSNNILNWSVSIGYCLNATYVYVIAACAFDSADYIFWISTEISFYYECCF